MAGVLELYSPLSFGGRDEKNNWLGNDSYFSFSHAVALGVYSQGLRHAFYLFWHLWFFGRVFGICGFLGSVNSLPSYR